MRRRDQPFRTIRSEGALLPPDLLQRISQGDKDLGGLRAEDYHVADLPLNEAIVRSWNRLVGAWTSFRDAEAALPEGDLATTVTRERWTLVLFDELSYGRLQTQKAVSLDGKEYPVSHAWGSVPIHLVGSRVPLDRRSAGVAGAAGQSPHGLVQELLNRSEERLWGFVSNGLLLRLLRDNSSLTRQAYLEFDLEQMLDSEAYSDFVVLWLTCHVSRLEAERPHECWLARWSQEAQRQGTRALDNLRAGVERAITELGAGFLSHRANDALRLKLRSGGLSTHDYYRELLRLAYRLLFLFAAGDRTLLHDPRSGELERERYERHYSTGRLRRLAERRRGTAHGDLYEGLKLVMRALGADEGEPALGLPALGSFLWSDSALPHLDSAQLANRDLLEAIRALCFVEERRVLRAVDYKNLGAEELGSVYESLLELHPELNADAGRFALTAAAGNERKTTGSYYTPTSLISVLLDSALDPVLEEAAQKGEEAILDLKVVDPACGSGHFLVATAHRIAKRLAAVRTGDEEPSPEATRHALRDVVSRCLYGVDVNPMAVELCKVSLWMEALDPGRPLSFLDAHVKCGNSLLGTTAALMAEGVPDDAFKALEGDDKEVAKALRKQNKLEREGQLTLEDETIDLVSGLQPQAERLEVADDATPEALHAKERLFRDLVRSDPYERAKLAADAWCAAFVQRKQDDALRITTGLVRRIASGNGAVPLDVAEEVRRLAAEYAFFHWEVEYPRIFGRAAGGFDVVLGNPPWERVKLQEKEFFAGHPEIARARNAAQRKRLIAALHETEPALYDSWSAALNRSEGESQLLRVSGRYPLCGRGDVNTYAVFAELMGALRAVRGYAGFIVPSGIASDHTTRDFFDGLMESGALTCLYGFENEGKLFPGIDHRVNFSIMCLGPKSSSAEFAAFLRHPSVLSEPGRRYRLRYEDVQLFNPNTRTCPVLRSERDLGVLRRIYAAAPVLWRDDGDVNPWELSFLSMFHMSNDSHLFVSRDDLDASGTVGLTRLYESKMINQFDHRFGDFGVVKPGDRDHILPAVGDHRKSDPTFLPQSRYWVSEEEVSKRLAGRTDRSWFLGWRDVTDARSSVRTVIATFLPQVGVGGNMPLAFTPVDHATFACLLANLNSFVLDYAARQKIGGVHLALFVLKQLPVTHPTIFDGPAWDGSGSVANWVQPRVTELCFTAVDLEGLASDLEYEGPPFIWDSARRALLRAELDAAFFHLYGLERDDVEYVMSTFPIVRRRDERAHGEYRTKRLILEIYDELAEAIATGRPYQTRLDPPPADPRVAHPPLDATITTRVG